MSTCAVCSDPTAEPPCSACHDAFCLTCIRDWANACIQDVVPCPGRTCRRELDDEWLRIQLDEPFQSGPISARQERAILKLENRLLGETVTTERFRRARLAAAIDRIETVPVVRTVLPEDLRATIERRLRELGRRPTRDPAWKENVLDSLLVLAAGLTAPAATIDGYCPVCPGRTSRGSCLACGRRVCSECRSEKKTGHVCRPDDLASVRTIRESAKPCPRCGVSIERRDGCFQMWCTTAGCDTAFHWDTLEILKVDEGYSNPEWIAAGAPGRAPAGEENGLYPYGFFAYEKQPDLEKMRDTLHHSHSILGDTQLILDRGCEALRILLLVGAIGRPTFDRLVLRHARLLRAAAGRRDAVVEFQRRVADLEGRIPIDWPAVEARSAFFRSRLVAMRTGVPVPGPAPPLTPRRFHTVQR